MRLVIRENGADDWHYRERDNYRETLQRERDKERDKVPRRKTSKQNEQRQRRKLKEINETERKRVRSLFWSHHHQPRNFCRLLIHHPHQILSIPPQKISLKCVSLSSKPTVDALVPAFIACWDYGKNFTSSLSPSKILLPQSILNTDANHMTSFSHLWSNRSSWSGSTCLTSLKHVSSSRPHTPATADLALTFVKVVPSAFSFVFGNVLLGLQNLVQKYFSDAFSPPSGSVNLLQSSYLPRYTLSSSMRRTLLFTSEFPGPQMHRVGAKWEINWIWGLLDNERAIIWEPSHRWMGRLATCRILYP